MILHFLKWDFRMFRTQWTLLLAGTLGVFFGLDGAIESEFLVLAFMMFALLPVGKLTGSKFRTQHEMSRNYLLSLPIPRRMMFLVLLCRLMVFALPFLILLWCNPGNFLVSVRSGAIHGLVVAPFFWRLLTPFWVMWFLSSAIHAQITSETISGHQKVLARFLGWTGQLGLNLIEFSALAWLSLEAMAAFSPHPLLRVPCVLGVIGICVGRMILTSRKWVQA